MTPKRLISLMIVASFACAPTSSMATSNVQKSLGTFGEWRSYTYNEGSQPVCYMVRQVKFAANPKYKRGPSFLMITHRPSENSKDVVSYTSGYNFRATSDAKLSVDGKPFSLFTQKDTAWSRDATTDRQLAAALRNGKNVKISGEPMTKIKGITAISDTIDLKGTLTAYKAISKACGIPVADAPKSETKKPETKKTDKKTTEKKKPGKAKSLPAKNKKKIPAKP